MRFGTSCAVIPASAPMEQWRDYVNLVERSGMSFIGCGDVMTRNFEFYVHMTMLALGTSRIGILPVTTNPVTRHPGVVASAWASLHKISNGRAVLGIGTGNSAVKNLGLKRAKVADLREHIETVRTLITTGQATYRGAQLSLPWGPEVAPKGVPIYIAADGPKTLELAGEIADGVMVGGGVSQQYVNEVYAALERGARKAGRKLSDIDIWFMCDIVFAESAQAAVKPSLNILAALCSRTFRLTFEGKAAPTELQPALLQFNELYDYSQHITEGNASLVERLGLTDFLVDRFLIAGSAQEIIAKLKEVAGYGVDQIFIPNIGADPFGFVEDFHRLVMPEVAAVTRPKLAFA